MRAALAAFEPRVALAKRKRSALDEDSGRPPLSVAVAIEKAAARLEVQVTRLQNDFGQRPEVVALLDPTGKILAGSEAEHRLLKRELVDGIQKLRDQADADHTFTWRAPGSRASSTYELSTAVAVLNRYKELDELEEQLEEERAQVARDALGKSVGPRASSPASPAPSPARPGTFDELVTEVRREEAQRRGLDADAVDALLSQDHLRAVYEMVGGDQVLYDDCQRARSALHQAYLMAHPVDQPLEAQLPSPPRASSPPDAPPPPPPPPPLTAPGAAPPSQPPRAASPPPSPDLDLPEDRPPLRQLLAEFDIPCGAFSELRLWGGFAVLVRTRSPRACSQAV